MAAEPVAPVRVLIINSLGRENSPYDVFASAFRSELMQRLTTPVAFHETSLDGARFDLALDSASFVRYLQNDDGTFHNFVYDREGTINTQGSTSYKSLGWWAVRSLWALAEGYRVFGGVDPAYAAELQASYRLTESALAAAHSEHYGEYNLVHGLRIPAWIPNGSADEASVALLALTVVFVLGVLCIERSSISYG